MTTTLITGANRSLGLETVRRLVDAGHTVYAGMRDPATGDTFLVRGGIPGERVTIAEHARPWRTEREVVAVEQGAAGRITPACSHAPACTGCSLLHIDEAAEDNLLRLTIAEVLARFAHLDWPTDRIEAIVPTRRGGTRVRARFAARFDEMVQRLGAG